MAPIRETSASQWRVATADGQMAVLCHEEATLYAHALSLDTSQRVIRCGVREKVAMDERVTLPPNATLVAVENVLDRELAIRLTLLVFCREEVSPSRPIKRARRNGSSSQTMTSTRLTMFSLWRGVNEGWELQPLGEVDLEGPALTMAVHIVDGPCVVVHNTISQELALLTAFIGDDGDYTFRVASQDLVLPIEEPHGAVKVKSCQLVDSDVTPTPHLLVQCVVNEEEDVGDSSEQVLEWRPKRDCHLWVTVTMPSNTSQASIQPCVYLPNISFQDITSVSSDHITSCSMVAIGPPTVSSPVICTSLPPRLYPSVTLLLGSSTGALHVISNEIRLGSYAVSGTPKAIKIVSTTASYDKRLIVAVTCDGSERSFYLLSMDVSPRVSHNITPMQQFKFVGSWLEYATVDHGNFSQSLVLLNESDSPRKEGFLENTLRRSVVVTFNPDASPNATSSCHRLKLKLEERNAKHSKSAQDDKPANFNFIERVKINRRDADLRDDNIGRSRDQPNASEQQLKMLEKSLEARLRIGRLQRDRLQAVSKEKLAMILRLSDLLMWSKYRGYAEESSRHQQSGPNMVNVIEPSLSNELREVGTNPQLRLVRNAAPFTLDSVRIYHFDPRTSMLQLEVQFHQMQRVPSKQNLFVSVVALQSPHTELRSSSRTLSSSANQTSFSFEVEVDIPIQHQVRPLSLGICVHEIADPRELPSADLPTASCLIGKITFDPIEAAKDRFCVKQSDWKSRGDEPLMIVSRGSCLRSWIGSMDQRSRALFGIVRPLFMTGSIGSSIVNKHHLHGLIRHLPSDAIAIVNPLSETTLSCIDAIVASLQSELDIIQEVERSSKSDSSARSFHQAQEKTDLHVVRLLNMLQQRVNFHVKMKNIML